MHFIDDENIHVSILECQVKCVFFFAIDDVIFNYYANKHILDTSSLNHEITMKENINSTVKRISHHPIASG